VFIDIMDRMMTMGEVEKMMVVAPCARGIRGMSHYENSELIGYYEDYIAYDVVRYVDEHFRTIPERDKRALMGHSRGGYGVAAILFNHTDIFCAGAIHSGARLAFEAGKERLINFYYARWPLQYAASFSPNLDHPPDYVDWLVDEKGAVVDSVWQRWLEHDPVTMLRRNVDAVRTLQGIYLDCGYEDKDVGFEPTQALHDELVKLDVPHVFAPYHGGHADKFAEERVPIALAFLSDALVREVTEVTADEPSEDTILPSGCRLAQNVPNPFNPSTTIGYHLPQAGDVTLTIYTITGQKATVLLDAYQHAGHHTVHLDGSRLGTGVYLYRLETESFVATKRMMLLR
jgi:S-formylglutathione hydrolase FrmB